MERAVVVEIAILKPQRGISQCRLYHFVGDVVGPCEHLPFDPRFVGRDLLALSAREWESVRGAQIVNGLTTLIAELGVGGVFTVSGHPTWSFFSIRDAYGFTSFETPSLMPAIDMATSAIETCAVRLGSTRHVGSSAGRASRQ